MPAAGAVFHSESPMRYTRHRKMQRHLSWTRSHPNESRKEYGKDETLPPRETNARVNSDARYLDYVRRGGVANCQEARAVLSYRLREVGGDVGVEVISQKVQGWLVRADRLSRRDVSAFKYRLNSFIRRPRFTRLGGVCD